MFLSFFILGLFSALLTLSQGAVKLGDESYRERVVVTPLPGHFLSFNFKFTTTKLMSGSGHFAVFPQVMAQLLKRYNLDEVHLNMVQGRWRYGAWAYPPYPQPSGTGANIWAWFNRGENQTEIDNRWKDFINSMSGLFCASLESIDKTMTVTPHFAFGRQDHRGTGKDVFSAQNVEDADRWLRYGTLPSETLCTENLTPWKKLLPCKSALGLSSLLNPTTVLHANYLSMSLDLRRITTVSDPSTKTLELIQSLNLVVPRPHRYRSSYSLDDVFPSGLVSPCPFAVESSGAIEVTDLPETYGEAKLENQTTKTVLKVASTGEKRSWLNFDLREKAVFKTFMEHSVPAQPAAWSRTLPLNIHCYMAGVGQHVGSIKCQLDHVLDAPTPIIYSHVIPWFLRTYLHTFRIECSAHGATKELQIDYSHFLPGKSREQPHFFEVHTMLPPKSTCIATIDFEKLILYWTEYPPDANHGFWLPGPIVKAWLPWQFASDVVLAPPFSEFSSTRTDNRTHSFEPPPGGSAKIKLWGEVMIVNMPTPDFSMPFNVICLVCTVVALAFGPIHTLTTKQMTYKHPAECAKRSYLMWVGEKSEPLMDWIIAKVSRPFTKLGIWRKARPEPVLDDRGGLRGEGEGDGSR